MKELFIGDTYRTKVSSRVHTDFLHDRKDGAESASSLRTEGGWSPRSPRSVSCSCTTVE